MSSQSYATLDDLRSAGLPPGALDRVALTDQQAALVRASRFADMHLADRYTMPLTAPYDPALVDLVCQVASYRLLTLRGFNPNGAIDASIRMAYDDACKALQRIANGQLVLSVTQAFPASNQPDLSTSPDRGYGGLCGVDVPAVGPNGAGF